MAGVGGGESMTMRRAAEVQEKSTILTFRSATFFGLLAFLPNRNGVRTSLMDIPEVRKFFSLGVTASNCVIGGQMRPGLSPIPASTRSHKYPHAGAEHIGIQVKVHTTIAQSCVLF